MTRQYGISKRNPSGVEENKTRCYEEIYGNAFEPTWQCTRKRGYGPGGLYCKQHAKKHKALPLNYEREESGAA